MWSLTLINHFYRKCRKKTTLNQVLSLHFKSNTLLLNSKKLPLLPIQLALFLTKTDYRTEF